MHTLKKFLFLALCIGLFPVVSIGKISGQNNILGKFYVSSIKGAVTCVSDSRIFELKKGDTVPARGAILETAAGANVTIVFSNGTGVYTDEKTRFEIKRFEQEFFAPNNNLRVEPSNSLTLVKLTVGRVVLSTPQLLSGTIMLYETPHSSVNIRGDKVLIEVNDKQTLTHIALISGNVSVVPRGADGNFLSIGKRLATGQEAFVKYTLNDKDALTNAVETDEVSQKPSIQSIAEAQADNTPGTGIIMGKEGTPLAPSSSKQAVTRETQATVLNIFGFVRAKLPSSSGEIALKEGSKLPKGTIVYTDAASELYLETFKGAIATLRPNSVVQIENLSVTTVQDVVKKQTSMLNLRSGTLISTIDPASKEINDYGVRTQKGVAHANGTSFSITVENEGYSVTATADTVLFTPPTGSSYLIKAGNISITPQGGQTQPPVTLSQALASDPGIATVIQNAMSTVANVVQHNIGNLSAESATNLITKVTNTASEAIPTQAANFATQAVNAVSSPASSTSRGVGAAVSAVTTAAVSGAPAQAVQISTAAAQAAPDQAANVAASSAKAAPSQAPQIAAAITVAMTPSSAKGPSQATIQAATAIATAVTTSVPNQAAPVAAAVMQAISQASPQSTPENNAQTASTIAAGVTGAAPNQAVPVAAIMMKTLTQMTPDASPSSVAQSAAVLATSVTSVVPPQAQQVATAVMQAVMQSIPSAQTGNGTAAQAAGLVTAAVSQVSPGSSQSISEGVAGATGMSVASVHESAQTSGIQSNQISQQVSVVTQQVGQANQQSNQASQSVAQATQQASAASGNSSSGASTSNSSTSSGSATASKSTSGTSSNSSTSSTKSTPSSTNTASTANASTGSTTSSSTSANQGSSSPSSTSSQGSSAVSGAAATGNGGSSAAASESNSSAPADRPTSIIVTQFNPAALELSADTQAAITGAGSVAPTIDNTGAGNQSTVQFTPTVPQNLPPQNTTSSAVINSGGG